MALIAPNSVQIFGQPLRKFLSKLDDRSQERELRRITHYMKQRGLIKYNPRDYENGITLTRAGEQRLKKAESENLAIRVPNVWDRKWRLVFFDIPEIERRKRNALVSKLRQLGFQLLQMSIWIHPFGCREEIEILTRLVGVDRYVTYVVINSIDNEEVLLRRFKSILRSVPHQS